MTSPHTTSRALALLRQMLGPQAQFRAGQLESIEAVVERRGRALVVQRTGWGKSLVYFLATKLLRDQGCGPTLLVSPLLSLMRNQIEAAAKIGISAFTINSSNIAEWDRAEAALADDACDILMISPERLGNERFKKSLLHGLWNRVGLFVVDEAHCISDWGHDFRPDYRRLINLIDKLPPGIPVLGTTATANNRVIADVHAQMGAGLTILRGPLVRTSLRLQNIVLPTQAERLAWLAQNISKFKGSGVIYCLTVADVERVAGWLKSKGISAAPYHAGDDTRLDRVALEQSLLANEIKALVATVALGMGFDKPDLAFVIHFQRPGSVVAYYQQVGRAGRALDRAYGILLSGIEDDEIQDYFIQSAFPSSEVMSAIVSALSANSLTMNQLLARINASHSMTERALKLLEVDGAVTVEHNGKAAQYHWAAGHWRPDEERPRRITALREAEVAQMRAYVDYRGCLMEFLTRELDDPGAEPCGVCANCQRRGFSADVQPEMVREAIAFLRGAEIILQPRKRWPAELFPELSSVIPEEMRNAEGRSLCYYGDAGWGKLVREGKYKLSHFSEELVEAAVDLIRERWQPSLNWVTAIPSPRHPTLVYDFASRLAKSLRIPFAPVLVRTAPAPEQKLMANSAMQARNVFGTLQTQGQLPTGDVLLVDDIIDSGWTLTLAGWLLRQKGSGVVHPFTLARATARQT